MTVPQALAEAARKHGGRLALVGPGLALTHAQLDACIARAAAALEARGVGPGVMVGISMRTSPLHLVTLLALARAGACSVHIHPDLPQPEKDALVAQFGIGTVIGWPGRPTLLQADRAWLEPGQATAQESKATPDAPFRVSLSSGTTGLQKAFLASQAEFVAYVARSVIPLTADDAFLCHRGLDSAWALCTVLAHLFAGGKVVFAASQSLPHFIEAAKRHAVTRLIMSPAFLRDLVAQLPAGAGGLPSVRLLLVGGGPSTPDLLAAGLERVSPNLITGYGTTELGLMTAADASVMRRAPASVGRLRAGFDVEAVDLNDVRVPPGQQGILRFRCENMPREYFRNPAASETAFREGWFYPGDLGRIDAEGLLYIGGRVDEELNLDGVKVEPGPIERILQEHESVVEAVVFVAAPGDSPGTLVAAVVLRAPVDEKALIAFCRSRVGVRQVPARIFFVKDFPRNEGGKVLRAALARLVARRSDNRATVPQTLSEAARRHADRPALIAPGLALTHAQFDASVSRAAAALALRGVGPGKVVGIFLETSPMHLLAVLAVARAGGCSVYVSPAFPQAAREALVKQFDVFATIGDAPGMIQPDADWLRPGRPAAQESWPDPQSAWRLALSSGTTGLQKAVVLKHADAVADLHRMMAVESVTGEDIMLCQRGLDANWVLRTALCHLVAGGAVVFPPSRTLPDLVATVKRHAVTRLVLSPVALRDLAEFLPAGSGGLPTLRHVLVGGGAFPAELVELAAARVTPHLVHSYGMTEIGIVTLADRELLRRAPRSAGRLLPDVEAEVEDAAGGRAPRGARGLLRFRRPGMAQEYVRNPAATAKAFRDGWFYPGDLGRIDADGLVYLEGRADDELNLGGIKVEPEPIERALHEHPAVLEAVAFAAAPDQGPAVLFAAVVPRVPVDEKVLRDHCRSRVGAMFTPVRIFFIDKLPRNEAGKVLRAELSRRIMRRQP